MIKLTPALSGVIAALLLVGSISHVQAVPLSSSFTYQGELTVGGSPANGAFDFQFELFDASTNGAQLATSLVIDDVSVINGIFNVELEFGPDPYAGEQLWVEIGVRNGSASGGFQGLAPRQKLTSVPYAQHAEMVAAGAIAGAEIANNSIMAADIGGNAVGASELADNAVDTNALQDLSVTYAKLAANSVNSANVVDGTLGSADINASQVQRRVSGSCSAGSWVSSVSIAGDVTCASRPTPVLFKVRGNGFAVKDLDAGTTAETDIWSVQAFDTVNAFNTTSRRYVAPETGYYYLHAVVRQSNNVTTSFFRISFNVDASLNYNQIQDEDDTKINVSGIYLLTAGQEVFVNLRNFGPSDVRIDGSGSWFEGYLIQ